MLPIFAAASRAMLIKLTCPKCGEVQARVRPAPGRSTYECRRCRATFTAEEGARPDTAPPPKR